MDSSTTTSIFPDKKSPHSRRSLSFSSSSLSSSSSLGSSYIFPDESPLRSTPATPLRFPGKPFSWEHLPGVPKKNIHKKKEPTILNIKQLPLPPPVTPPSSKKHHFQDNIIGNSKKFSTSSSESFRINDPFVAALVECSKDDDDGDRDDHEDSSTSNFWSVGSNNKVGRSISDRFGFVNLYTSCKRTCAVSESIVYLPRSTRSSYDLMNHPPRRI
ncbi:hypothetical protein Dsin_002312 [Dipteronia sinensis]|uniref:Uncharacterized protein n=1 Tax=Dipteronia sinensis TaxID=43782 RepID=A0AAE0B5Z8_9ROSI|nr:hypothetical protein Dsin_002312 [Dipteronia sinensis]